MILRTALCLILLVPASVNAASAPRTRAAAVLTAAARSMGRLETGAALESRGTIEAEGRSGQYSELVRARDGAFARRSAYPLFVESDGYDGQVRWKQDRSGASHALNAPFTRADAVTQAWLKRRGYLRAGSARLEGMTHETIGERPATVLALRPPGGNEARLAFDDVSHLLIRAQADRPISTITETYGDYRRVGRVMAPFRIEIEESGDHQRIRIDRYARLASPARIQLSAPTPPADTIVPGEATIPLEGAAFAVLPARINGHAFDFILDTGGHNIVTPEVAAELGLNVEGEGTSGGSGPGRVRQGDTRIRSLEIGSAAISDQHFYVIDLGNAIRRTGRPPMAGILGLETFERMTLTLNERGNILKIEPNRIEHVCRGDRIPLMFDDDQPTVGGTIDGTPGLIGIDTGNGGIPIIFWRWAEAHGMAARFRDGQAQTGSGVGGNNTSWRTAHHDVVVGQSALRDVNVNYSESRAGAFSSRSDAANLGRALLQNFVVTFDYAHGHMCVVPATGS